MGRAIGKKQRRWRRALSCLNLALVLNPDCPLGAPAALFGCGRCTPNPNGQSGLNSQRIASRSIRGVGLASADNRRSAPPAVHPGPHRACACCARPLRAPKKKPTVLPRWVLRLFNDTGLTQCQIRMCSRNQQSYHWQTHRQRSCCSGTWQPRWCSCSERSEPEGQSSWHLLCRHSPGPGS